MDGAVEFNYVLTDFLSAGSVPFCERGIEVLEKENLLEKLNVSA